MDQLYLAQLNDRHNCKTLKDFSTICLIGKGSYAKVVLVRFKQNNRIYALKVIKKKNDHTKQQVERIKNERTILSQLDCPFLIQLKYAFQDEKNLFFVLQYCPGGELFNLLRKRKTLNEESVKFYAGQIIVALKYLHSQNIIYRDLKPENVLIDLQGYIKLTDFGLSKMNVNEDDYAYSICGTTEYLAPEVLFREGHGKTVDWWTLGTIIYEMYFGKSPFYSHRNNETIENIKYANPVFSDHNQSPQFQDLLQKLLKKDPQKRLGYKGAQQIMEHEWFSNIDWQKLNSKEYIPPFIPQLNYETDTQNFDSIFTNQRCNSLQSDQKTNNQMNNSNSDSTYEFDKYDEFYFSRDSKTSQHLLQPSSHGSNSFIMLDQNDLCFNQNTVITKTNTNTNFKDYITNEYHFKECITNEQKPFCLQFHYENQHSIQPNHDDTSTVNHQTIDYKRIIQNDYIKKIR